MALSLGIACNLFFSFNEKRITFCLVSCDIVIVIVMVVDINFLNLLFRRACHWISHHAHTHIEISSNSINKQRIILYGNSYVRIAIRISDECVLFCFSFFFDSTCTTLYLFPLIFIYMSDTLHPNKGQNQSYMFTLLLDVMIVCVI